MAALPFIAKRVAQIVGLHGQTMTLRRTGETDLAVIGKRVPDAGLDPTGGTSAQQSFRVRVRTTELDASAWATKRPKRHDLLQVDGTWRTVEDARPLGDAGTPALYELTVTG
jgi:hypothetical protein